MAENRIYNILIVDDDIEFHKDTRIALRHNYIFDAAVDKPTFLEKVKTTRYDLILLDLVLTEGSLEKEGLNLMPEISNQQAGVPVIIVTADNNVETVVDAMKRGASDYVHKKDINYDLLDEKFRKTIQNQDIKQENLKLKAEIKKLKNNNQHQYPFVGDSPEIERIKRTLRIVSEEPNLTVLITGETGVGKEVAARYLHRHGARKDKPFQAVNLSAIQSNLLESELFGHVKGAFTGATRSKEGYFKQANEGILMLDEIGDIGQNIQIKLLRFLETKLIRPVGSDKDIKLDIQIVAATHKDLREEVKKGNFREDLYQRLKAKIIEIPPLRKRRSDIPLIIDHYLSQQSNNAGIISEEAMDLLLRYAWKGNVRELRYAIDGMLLERRILDLRKVEKSCLPTEIQNYQPIQIESYPAPSNNEVPSGTNNFNVGVGNHSDAERQKALIDLNSIENALIKRNKVKGDAASDLGFNSSDNLRYRIKTYFEKYPELFDDFPVIKTCYKKVFSR